MDAEVEVVFLGSEVSEVILTSVEVQSDKAKRAVVVLPIHPDVFTTHEAHVGVEEERTSPWSGACPRPLHVGHADKAIEICDGRRFLTRAKELDVKGSQREWDRIGVAGNWGGRVCQLWHPETGAK
jgi:hypothetical protein